MKLKLIVSSLFALGVMSVPPLAFGAANDLGPNAKGTTPADADFPKVGGNLGNQNYSSLTQINKHNLNKLGAVWRTRISAAPTTTRQRRAFAGPAAKSPRIGICSSQRTSAGIAIRRSTSSSTTRSES